jgi:hypothetical protein
VIGKRVVAVSGLQSFVPAALAALLLSVSVAVPPSPAAPPPVPEGFRHVVSEGRFACDVPEDWVAEESLSAPSSDGEAAYGVTVTAPGGGDVPVRISVRYYAEGNRAYGSADAYVRRFSEPTLGSPLEGSAFGKVESTVVAGRAAREFEREGREFVPLPRGIGALDDDRADGKVYERERMARPVPVRERFVVLPAAAGFYALRYSAPADRYAGHLPAFGKVAASFDGRK